MKKTRFEIEMLVAKIIDDFADEFELEKNFYGDCYPIEIIELENRMEHMNDKEIEMAIEELKRLLIDWYLRGVEILK